MRFLTSPTAQTNTNLAGHRRGQHDDAHAPPIFAANEKSIRPTNITPTLMFTIEPPASRCSGCRHKVQRPVRALTDTGPAASCRCAADRGRRCAACRRRSTPRGSQRHLPCCHQEERQERSRRVWSACAGVGCGVISVCTEGGGGRGGEVITLRPTGRHVPCMRRAAATRGRAATAPARRAATSICGQRRRSKAHLEWVRAWCRASRGCGSSATSTSGQ